MLLPYRFLPLCSALVLAGCAGLPSGGPKPDVEVAITILHTNDHHGRFWKNRDGEYGMAARKTVVDQIRKEVAAAGGYSPGGDIFIHGQPNALAERFKLGGDWTAGCIALTNAEMREIWAVTPIGTKVEIRP